GNIRLRGLERIMELHVPRIGGARLDRTDGNRFPSSPLNTKTGRQPNDRAQQLAPNGDRWPQAFWLSLDFSVSSRYHPFRRSLMLPICRCCPSGALRLLFSNRTTLLVKPPVSCWRQLPSDLPKQWARANDD